jgi:hypothetical protein
MFDCTSWCWSGGTNGRSWPLLDASPKSAVATVCSGSSRLEDAAT